MLASVRQQLREIWRRPALRPFVIFPYHDRRMALPSRKTNRAKQNDDQCREMIAGKRTQNSWRRAHKFVRKTKEAVPDEIKMEVLTWQKFSMPKKQKESERE